GFASGALQGGLLLGGHTPGGVVYGVRIDYSDNTQKIAGSSHSTTAFSIGLAGRFPVAGRPDGFDLALAADAAFVKAQVGSGPGEPGTGASGIRVGFGPQLRYWFHPNVAVGYLVQLNYLNASSDTSPSGEKLEQSTTSIAGAFT